MTTKTQSVLIERGHTRDGFYRFHCYQCSAQLELPFTFDEMLKIYEVVGVFELPALCPVKFCWACGKQFAFGKIVR